MTKLYTVLFVMAMSLLVSCDRENADDISNEMAIRMSVSVDKTKTILTTDNIINTSIGVFGYKEQISNQSNKFLVFNNEKLSFESDSWVYDPIRYWDTQTAYSFIAYAPYQENSNNLVVNDFEGITISGIPQWQDADDAESKDYVVALTDSAATNYINNGGVDLKFHHILANLKITAYKEGDAAFEIHSISIGDNIDNQRVPSEGTLRSYVQNFNAERADGEFSEVELSGNPVSLFAGNMAVEQAANVVANLLVAPFTAGADLPLTITYTENGAEKSATINSGITEFISDAVYNVTLKFIDNQEPLGPFGPGIIQAPVSEYAYSITDGSRTKILAFDYNGGTPFVKTVASNHHEGILWMSSDDINDDTPDKFSINYDIDGTNTVSYYLTCDEDGQLLVTDNPDEACSFKTSDPNLPGFSMSCYDKDGVLKGRIVWNSEKQKFEVSSVLNFTGSIQESRCWRTSNIIECHVTDRFAGPVIYVNNNSSFSGFNVYTQELSPGGRLDFDVVASRMDFQYFFDGNMTRFFFEGCTENMYQQVPDQVYTNWNWSLEGADGYAEIDNNGTINYYNQAPADIIIVVTVRGIAEYNPVRYIEGYFRLKLKG